MGQGLSCREGHVNGLFVAISNGDLAVVRSMIEEDPTVLESISGRDKISALHIAATNGQIEILSLLLDWCFNPDIQNRHKQTPLMLAAIHGKISCVQKLLQAGANVLMFDSLHERTCLHYAAYYGHFDCLEAILSSAHSTPVADSWGFARFVNIRDGRGATPLHLAASQGRHECIHTLLNNGALVSASTGGFVCRGSTPLHLAARAGSLECIRELLAWGADRVSLDSSERIPYMVALKYKHRACAALLNPSSAAPLLWPASLSIISELSSEAKALLEKAFMQANMEREQAILNNMVSSLPTPLLSDTEVDDNNSEVSEIELCCICFDQLCSIEIRECGHQMCAHCTLALCCHNKPNAAATLCSKSPICPFCRSNITQLVVAKIKTTSNDMDLETSLTKARRSTRKSSEGSSSFKGLSAIGSFGKIGGRNSGKVAAECDHEDDKP